MAYKERIGATGDSLRIKNNEWYIARSFEGDSDIPIFRVNTLDQIEFASIPYYQGQTFITSDQFEELEEKVTILEEIVFSISSGNTNIYPYTLTSVDITNKSITLPHTPLPGKCVIIPAQGIPQLVDFDFVTSGTILDWDGQPYEEVAAVGDAIKVIYLY